MLNKISKPLWSYTKIKLQSEITTLSKMLFEIHNPKIDSSAWIEKISLQLRKIDAVVYRTTLCEDSISEELEVNNKASLMREKVKRLLSKKLSSKLLETEKNSIAAYYFLNVIDFIQEKIEVVDQTTDSLEDNLE
jgi:hypothetical protein